MVPILLSAHFFLYRNTIKLITDGMDCVPKGAGGGGGGIGTFASPPVDGNGGEGY